MGIIFSSSLVQMKTLSILLRLYFAFGGVMAAIAVISVFMKPTAWSMWVVASIVVSLFLAANLLCFAAKLNQLLPKRKHYIQGIIFILLLNQVLTAFNGSVGLNHAKEFNEVNIQSLLILSFVAVIFYGLLIFAVEKLSNFKLQSSSPA